MTASLVQLFEAIFLKDVYFLGDPENGGWTGGKRDVGKVDPLARASTVILHRNSIAKMTPITRRIG